MPIYLEVLGKTYSIDGKNDGITQVLQAEKNMHAKYDHEIESFESDLFTDVFINHYPECKHKIITPTNKWWTLTKTGLIAIGCRLDPTESYKFSTKIPQYLAGEFIINATGKTIILNVKYAPFDMLKDPLVYWKKAFRELERVYNIKNGFINKNAKCDECGNKAEHYHHKNMKFDDIFSKEVFTLVPDDKKENFYGYSKLYEVAIDELIPKDDPARLKLEEIAFNNRLQPLCLKCHIMAHKNDKKRRGNK